MTINVTLVFQILNFIIAYHVLRAWIIEPLLVALEEDENSVRLLGAKVYIERERLARKELERDAFWSYMREQYLRETPHLTKNRNPRTRLSTDFSIGTPQDYQDLVDEIACKLVEQVREAV